MSKKSIVSEKNRHGIRPIFDKKFIVAMLIISILCVCKSTVNASSYKAEQREKIRVGFFAMDGYHMMDIMGFG